MCSNNAQRVLYRRYRAYRQFPLTGVPLLAVDRPTLKVEKSLIEFFPLRVPGLAGLRGVTPTPPALFLLPLLVLALREYE